MLWLCIFLPQMPLEALIADESQPTVVFVNEQNKRRILNCNASAAKLGLDQVGEFTTAQAIYPKLCSLERNGNAELKALKRLAAWAYQWSSHVTWQEAQPALGHYAATLWLEIGASRKLFGSYTSLIRQLEHSLQLLHYTYRLGVAPTIEGAALFARANKRVLITSEQQLLFALKNVAVRYLDTTSEVSYALSRSGIFDIGTLLSMPSASLARRFGPYITSYLERLCGNAPDPRPLYKLPKKYSERCDFGFAVNSTEALLFPLQRMLHEFCGYLRAIDGAISHFSILLEHEFGAITSIEIHTATASRDTTRLFGVLKEKLHNLKPHRDVYGLRFEAKEFVCPVVRQSGLFGSEVEITDELQQTLEKITTRLGQDAVRQLQLVADYRPEHAFQLAADSPARTIRPISAARPLWFLSEPQRFSPQIKPGTSPERITSGWWDAPIDRDYYTIRFSTGEKGWVFFNRRDGEWYLHGYWS